MDSEFVTKLLELLKTVGTWENLVQLFTLLLVYLGTNTQIVNFVNWLKGRLGWDAKKAELLVIGTAVVVSIATLVVQGLIVPEALTIANFGVLVGTVTYAAHKRYLRLQQVDLQVDVAYLERDVQIAEERANVATVKVQEMNDALTEMS